jgi:hypothetical protein
MFSTRNHWLVFSALLAGGCVARGPAKPAPLANTPLPADQATILRDWHQSTAVYANGSAVSGPTEYNFEPKQDAPEWTHYYADTGTWALNTLLLPYYLVVTPQWTEFTSPGEVVLTTYSAQPPLPPQVSPGYIPRDMRPTVAPVVPARPATSRASTGAALPPSRPIAMPAPVSAPASRSVTPTASHPSASKSPATMPTNRTTAPLRR